MLTLLLERPTDDSVEVAIAFLKECGLKLTEVSPRGINGTTSILFMWKVYRSAKLMQCFWFCQLSSSVCEMCSTSRPSINECSTWLKWCSPSGRTASRTTLWSIPEGLDLVDEDDQFTHMMPLEDDYNTEDMLSKNQHKPGLGHTSLIITSISKWSSLVLMCHLLYQIGTRVNSWVCQLTCALSDAIQRQMLVKSLSPIYFYIKWSSGWILVF